jgi:hypothetical protein
LALRGIVEHGDDARVLQGEPLRHLATCIAQAKLCLFSVTYGDYFGGSMDLGQIAPAS